MSSRHCLTCKHYDRGWCEWGECHLPPVQDCKLWEQREGADLCEYCTDKIQCSCGEQLCKQGSISCHVDDYHIVGRGVFCKACMSAKWQDVWSSSCLLPGYLYAQMLSVRRFIIQHPAAAWIKELRRCARCRP